MQLMLLLLQLIAGHELFSLRDSTCATFRLAEEVAEGDSRILQLWADEQAAAEARIAAHWADVQRKQSLAARARQKVADARAVLSSKQKQLSDAEYTLNITDKYEFRSFIISLLWTTARDRFRACSSAVDSAKSDVKAAEAALTLAEAAPPPVIQPLPKSRALALQWLFFLYMPPLFRRLSRAAFLCQQLLLPPTAEVQSQITVPSYQTSLTAHYNNHQKGQWYQNSPRVGSDGAVLLVCRTFPPCPSSVGPKHVDHFFSRGVDGIWYPDSLVPLEMGWKGSGSTFDHIKPSGYFNPFKALAAECELFTGLSELAVTISTGILLSGHANPS
jgi:hypothetical protein